MIFFSNNLNRYILSTLVGLLLLTLVPTTSFAQFNPEINYQGKLTNASGVAVPDGLYNMNFWLVPTGGGATSTAVWSEVHTSGNRVQVVNGLFSVMLGDVSALASVNFNQTLYLGVEVGGISTSTPVWDGEMSPRKILGAVPAAFVSNYATSAGFASSSLVLGGVASSSFLRSDEADTMTASSSSSLLTLVQNGVGKVLALFSGATEIFTALSNGNIGIGTTTPYSTLTLTDSTSATGGIGFGSDVALYRSAASQFSVSLGGAERMRWALNGGVGQFQMVGAGTAAAPKYSWTGDTTTGMYMEGTGLGFATAGTNRITITNAGRIGIGTTTPGSTLSVVGDLRLTGGFRDSLNASGTLGMILQSTGTSTFWSATSTLGLGNGTFTGLSETQNSLTANRVIFTNSGGTSLTDSANFIFDGTNLGIGSTTPSSKLTVTGNAYVGGNITATGTIYTSAIQSPVNSNLIIEAQAVTSGFANSLYLSGGNALFGGGTGGEMQAFGGTGRQAGGNFFFGGGNAETSFGGAGGNIDLATGLGDGAGQNGVLTLQSGIGPVITIQDNLTASQLGFFGATPIVKAGATTDLRQMLIDYGLYTTGGATPLNLNGGTLTAGALSVSGASTLANASTTNITVSGDSYLSNLRLVGAFRDASNASGTLGMVLQTTGTSTRWVATSTLGFSDGTFTGLSDTQNSLTANRVIFTNSGGTSLTDSASLIFDGTNFGIGTSTPASRLSVAGTISVTNNVNLLSTTAGGAAGVLNIDGERFIHGYILDNTYGTNQFMGYQAGNFTLGSSTNQFLGIDNLGIGRFALGALTTGSDNTVVGQGAMQFTTTGYSNTAMGRYALQQNISGNSNTALGTNALNVSTSSSNNTAVGNAALADNTAGQFNTAVGSIALVNNTLGEHNTAIGYNALDQNTEGNYNVAIGGLAVASNLTSWGNVGIGYYALNAATGGGNIAIGRTAGSNIVGGDNNTIIGNESGLGIVTGDYNTILGANVSGLSSSLSNNIIIADGQGNRRINVDSSGNVGIGTTSPSAKLDVWGGLTIGTSSIPVLYANSALRTVGVRSTKTTDTLNVGNGGSSASDLASIALFAPVDHSAAQSFDDGGKIFSVSSFGQGGGYYQGGAVVRGMSADTGVAGLNLFGYQRNSSTVTTPTVMISGSKWNGASATASLTGSDLVLGVGTSSSNPNIATFMANGNVGIGTTTQASKLTIVGDTYITGAFRDGANASGTLGMVLQTTGTSTRWVATSTLGISGATTFLALTDTPSSFTANRVMYTNSGATALTDSANFTFDGTNLNLGAQSRIGFGGTNYLYASSTNDSVSFGENAGATFNSGTIYNTALGFEAGRYASTTNSDYNNFIGYRAGLSNFGSENNIIGYEAGMYNQGNNSNLFGRAAGYLNTGAYANLFGLGAGEENEGDSVNLLGYRAGQFNSGDDLNSFGYESGRFNTGTFNNFMGLSAGSQNAGHGVNAFGLYTGSTNTGSSTNLFGSYAGFANAGDYVDAIGALAGYANSGDYNSFIGYSAGATTTGNYNNALGYSAGASTTGSYNNFLGYIAGQTNTGTYNNLIGAASGYSNSGSFNNIIGAGAGYVNNGSYNEIIGYEAGRNLRATSSIIIGSEAFRGGSGFIPFNAVNNTALGYRAGYAAQTGADNNILIGYQAADNLTTGNNNIVIGYDIDNITATTDNSLNIGNLIFGTGLTATGTTLSSGNIGIGTSTPASKLSVVGDLRLTGAFRDGANASGTIGMILQTTGTSTRWVATSTLGISGATTFLALTDTPSSFTANRIMYTNSGATALIDSADFTFNGTNLGLGSDDGISLGGTRMFTASSTINVIKIGMEAGLNSTTSNNVFIGEEAGQDNTGSGSIIIGQGAGFLNSGDNSILLKGGTYNIGTDLVAIGGNAGTNNEGDYSVLIGTAAGQNNTGSNLSAIGFAAGQYNTGDRLNAFGQEAGNTNTGSENNMFGYYAGGANTGSYNNMMGTDAGAYNSGSFNNFFGFAAGASSTGSLSNFIGAGAGYRSTGNYNEFIGIETAGLLQASATVAVGSGALRGGSAAVDVGTPFQAINNTAIGFQAGYAAQTGANNNILLGYRAADNLTTGNNNIIIGYDIDNITATTDNTLNIGNLIFGTGIDGTGTTLSSGNIGIGTSTPASKLSIAGDMRLTGAFRDGANASGTLGMILQTTGTSTRWVATSTLGIGGGSSLFTDGGATTYLTSTGDNLAIGTTTASSRLTVDGNMNVTGNIDIPYTTSGGAAGVFNVEGQRFIHTYALDDTYGDNIFVGRQAGNFTLGSSTNQFVGLDNVGIGSYTLGALTTGGNNTAVGQASLGNTTTGGSNTAVGFYSLIFNTTGDSNTAVGRGALSANTTGRRNTAIGNGALDNNETGESNTVLGAFVANNLTSGNNNIIIGHDIDAVSASADYTLNIGNLIFGTGLDGVDSTLSGGNIGIGTTSPSAKLDVWGNFQVGTSSTPILFANTAARQLSVGTTNVLTDLDGNTALMGLSGDEGARRPLLVINEESGNQGASGVLAFTRTFNYADNRMGAVDFQNSARIEAWTDVGDDVAGSLRFLTDGPGAGPAIAERMRLTSTGNLGIGTTTPVGRLGMENLNFSSTSSVAGIDQYFSFSNSNNGAALFGNRSYLYATNTATTTIVGSIFRLEDSTTFGNTVRGLEVQTDRGNNTRGENTALSGFARTFGVRGTTAGDAGGTFEPAGVYGETQGTTQGNAIRGYSSTITTTSLLKLFQDTSTYVGTGLLMNFGNGSGSFSSTTASKFIDLQNAGTSLFTVGARGMTTIGDGTTSNNAGLQIGYGGICVDNDGSCNASTTGRISAISYHTGNSDLAEMYFSSDNLKTGEIVSLRNGLSINRAGENNANKIIGVVTTKPGLLLGFDDESLRSGEEGYGVALSGRVPVRLSNENGEIKAGDELMLSSVPGVAMKASSTGTVVGIALEDFNESRAYSDTYINQFGDDLVDPVVTPINKDNDPRINDGCYYGAGSASGEAPCVPLIATSTDGQAAEAQMLANAEAQAEALAALKNIRSEQVTLDNGSEVRIGQIVMFVSLNERFLDEEGKTMIAALVAGALDSTGDVSEETVWTRLVTLANNFVDGVLSILTLKADRVEVKEEICVDGVCLNAEDLRQLLDSQSIPQELEEEEPAPEEEPEGEGTEGSVPGEEPSEKEGTGEETTPPEEPIEEGTEEVLEEEVTEEPEEEPEEEVVETPEEETEAPVEESTEEPAV